MAFSRLLVPVTALKPIEEAVSDPELTTCAVELLNFTRVFVVTAERDCDRVQTTLDTFAEGWPHTWADKLAAVIVQTMSTPCAGVGPALPAPQHPDVTSDVGRMRNGHTISEHQGQLFAGVRNKPTSGQQSFH